MRQAIVLALIVGLCTGLIIGLLIKQEIQIEQENMQCPNYIQCMNIHQDEWHE